MSNRERSIRSLRKMAAYQLPPELDRRILEMGERKTTLTPTEHAELLAWVDFTQQRTLEKLSAEVALKRLGVSFIEFLCRDDCVSSIRTSRNRRAPLPRRR